MEMKLSSRCSSHFDGNGLVMTALQGIRRTFFGIRVDWWSLMKLNSKEPRDFSWRDERTSGEVLAGFSGDILRLWAFDCYRLWFLQDSYLLFEISLLYGIKVYLLNYSRISRNLQVSGFRIRKFRDVRVFLWEILWDNLSMSYWFPLLSEIIVLYQ